MKKVIITIAALLAMIVIASANPSTTLPSVGVYWQTATNPTGGTGVSAPIGQILFRTDVPSVYYKSGSSNTAWTLLGTVSTATISQITAGQSITVTNGTGPNATVALNFPTTACTAGSAIVSHSSSGAPTCSAFVTNTAGNNVLAKSNGTNVVGSSWTDNGTTTSTSDLAVILGTGNTSSQVFHGDQQIGTDSSSQAITTGYLEATNVGVYLKDKELGVGLQTNSSDTLAINKFGYQRATSQFRDAILYDGKAAAVCTWTGSTKTIDCTVVKQNGVGVVDTAGTGLSKSGSSLAVNLSTTTCSTGQAVTAISSTGTGTCASVAGGGAWPFQAGSEAVLSPTFDGTTTVAGVVPSGNVYSFPSGSSAREYFWTDVTINSGVELRMNGSVGNVSGTTTCNGGTIDNDGRPGGAIFGGAAGPFGVVGDSSGGNGGDRGFGGGAQSDGISFPSETSNSGASGGTAGNGGGAGLLCGGGGGGGSTTAGGSGAGSWTPMAIQQGGITPLALAYGLPFNRTNTGNRWSGGSGGGGGANTNGTGTGAGGGGGALVWRSARLAGTTCTVSANGGAGGNASGNDGSGGGGGGGFANLVYGVRDSGTWTVSANGGNGGTGGRNGGAGGGCHAFAWNTVNNTVQQSTRSGQTSSITIP